MGNVICCISSLLSGLGTPKVYFDRIEDALKSDPKGTFSMDMIDAKKRISHTMSISISMS